MFDTELMSFECINADRPDNVPLRPNGTSHPVIARFVLADHSEIWRPATAVRWTDTHVMITHVPDAAGVTTTWLPAGDVARWIRRPPPGEVDPAVG